MLARVFLNSLKLGISETNSDCSRRRWCASGASSAPEHRRIVSGIGLSDPLIDLFLGDFL